MRVRRSVVVATAVVVVSVLATSQATGTVTTDQAPRHTAVAAARASAWTAVFTDGFDQAAGSGVGSDWVADLGTQYDYPGAAPQWGTWEVETNTADRANLATDGRGHLAITPRRDAAGHWTSARIQTRSHAFTAPVGGQLRLTASIKLPGGSKATGIWPAFWAMGQDGPQNWPRIGELDIMESVNGLSAVSHTVHCDTWTDTDAGACREPDGLSSGLQACDGCTTGFHRYTAVVDRRVSGHESVGFYVDGALRFQVAQSSVPADVWAAAVQHGFFMILDVAVGGSYPDKVCGCVSSQSNPTPGVPMLIDNVGVYTSGGGYPPTAPPTSPTPTPTPAGSAYAVREAEQYTSMSGVTSTQLAGASAGRAVSDLSSGDWTRYGDVDFGSTPGTRFTVRTASSAAGGVSGLVQVRLDSPSAPVVGEVEVGPTSGAWVSLTQSLAPTTGVHDVYLTYASGQPAPFADVDTLVFGR